MIEVESELERGMSRRKRGGAGERERERWRDREKGRKSLRDACFTRLMILGASETRVSQQQSL